MRYVVQYTSHINFLEQNVIQFSVGRYGGSFLDESFVSDIYHAHSAQQDE